MLGVAEDLELHRQCSVKDIDASTLLVGLMMTERKKRSQHQLEIQLQWDKDSSLLALQAIDVGCRQVNEIHIELGDAITLQSKNDRMCFPMGARHIANIDEGSQQTSLISCFFLRWSCGSGSRCRSGCSAHCLLELDCDKCQSDKRQFFTVKSPNNKGRNTANNTLKKNFPALMFHQKNSCYHMQIQKL